MMVLWEEAGGAAHASRVTVATSRGNLAAYPPLSSTTTMTASFGYLTLGLEAALVLQRDVAKNSCCWV
jgi:hypothetical protein